MALHKPRLADVNGPIVRRFGEEVKVFEALLGLNKKAPWTSP